MSQPHDSTGQKGRKLRLRKIHYDTADLLHMMHKPCAGRPQPTIAQSAGLKLALVVLAAAVELPPTEQVVTELTDRPGEMYLASIRALVRAGQTDEHPAAALVQALCAEYQTTCFGAARPATPEPEQPLPPAEPPEACDGERMINISHAIKVAGIKKQDRIYVQVAARELQPGEVCALYTIGGNGWQVGIVEAVTPDTITITQWGKTRHFQRADLQYICRATWKARRVRRVADDGRAGKIARLRSRLEELEESGALWDCTERFKLEKQIYDLERESERDEWPEVINA